MLDITSDIQARADAEEGIRRGLDDVSHGRTRPASEFFEAFEAKNGIPRQDRFPRRARTCHAVPGHQ